MGCLLPLRANPTAIWVHHICTLLHRASHSSQPAIPLPHVRHALTHIQQRAQDETCIGDSTLRMNPPPLHHSPPPPPPPTGLPWTACQVPPAVFCLSVWHCRDVSRIPRPRQPPRVRGVLSIMRPVQEAHYCQSRHIRQAALPPGLRGVPELWVQVRQYPVCRRLQQDSEMPLLLHLRLLSRFVRQGLVSHLGQGNVAPRSCYLDRASQGKDTTVVRRGTNNAWWAAGTPYRRRWSAPDRSSHRNV